MEKRKRWHQFLILGVLILTVYNILPTVFFYSKPLNSPITAERAEKISGEIASRVNNLENDSLDWLRSFCKQLKVRPQNISLEPNNPQHISLTFKDVKDADRFREYLPRAGSLIPFVPAQLSLYQPSDLNAKTVTVARKIPIHFDTEKKQDYFQYSKKFTEQGAPTPLYKALVFDRALQLGMSIASAGENTALALAITNPSGERNQQDLTLKLSQDLLSFVKIFGETDSIAKRYFASFSHVASGRDTLIDRLLASLEQTKDQIKLERISIQSEEQTLQAKGQFLETEKHQRLEQLAQQENTIADAAALIKKHKATFAAGTEPISYATLSSQMEQSYLEALDRNSKIQTLSFGARNPFVEQLVIDWANETLTVKLFPDVEAFRENASHKKNSYIKDLADQFLYNEIAFESRTSGEEIRPSGKGYLVKLNQLEGSNSFLAMRLSSIASARIGEIERTLKEHWHPKHPDLQKNVFPIWNNDTYQKLPAYEKKLGLLLYSPAMESELPQNGLRNSSLYVVAKGLDKILEKIQASPNSDDSKLFYEDFNKLKTLLKENGMFGYPGSTLAMNKEFSQDFVFEAEDFFLPVLKATREELTVHGSKRYAILELTNEKQRILTENRIDDKTHEDLLKWRDDYRAAQVGVGGASPFDIAKPTKNPLWDNLKLSTKKYFRGDDRKILNWGLDLSGGKTVQIELRDQNNRPVTNEEDIKQGINELYARVNKMGVSEVSIRSEGNFITLDFPGSQGLSASELIKASTMYFHIANEKFNEYNPALAEASNQFLQDIWNEAVVTGRKSPEEINQIAWRHIHGDSLDSDFIQPRSEAARILHENGLRLSSPLDNTTGNLFNDAVSQIALLRGDDFTEWHGKTHPLMIVFRNFALEGANLKNVQAGYDQNRGNFLVFEIKGKETLKSGEKINPREDLYAWTSQFSKDKIAGTPNAIFSSNNGWRMAVLLNGSIVTAPTLTYPIRDGGSIEGNFTQRDVNQLEADLKAGSLTFTPRILSEKNVSPELGAKERNFGILATIIALALVILCMVAYYRFGGVIASVAVVVNLLIMWATLQNLGATLTLASIAGGILTLGMAVDANVLVFERIREEFSLSGRLASAVHAGYRKAFSAILDSNVTTIIAAVILLQFDSGPIKGLALTLIIGIASSMFTALFMTRYFFSSWVQNPKHTKLNMSQLIKATKFPFLKFSKVAFIVSGALILVGAYMFINQRHTVMGMDFTGGYSLSVELNDHSDPNSYREKVEKALLAAGAKAQNFEVRQLTPKNHIRLFLGKGMQQPGMPFYNMPLENPDENFAYSYQTNPRITWVVNALESGGLTVTKDSLATLDQNWSEMSGQLSDSMRNSALIGLGIAILSILLYITFRFEFKYAISATLCLAHDIGITLALIALLKALGLPLQIDLNTVAALMTIVGYSLNDTIIVFDRIREDVRLMRKSPFTEIVNHALNVTLSRTLMTSMTTLLVLLPLVFLGGSTIFAFSLVMIVGVIFGTLSSLFIAAPMLNFFHQRQTVEGKEKRIPEIVR